MGIRTASLTTLALVGAGFAVMGSACSGKTLPFPGGLMVAVQTDLVAPKDVAAVGLFISSDGKPIFGDTRDVAPNGEVRFPATIAIVADENRPKAAIKIRVVAFGRDGKVRVLRDALTTVPRGRTAVLRTPLLWINQGSGTGTRSDVVQNSIRLQDAVSDGFIRLRSACPEGQTFLEGACGDANVDAASLPDYKEADVFGGGTAQGVGGACFDVKACFASNESLDAGLVGKDCVAAVPEGSDPNDPNLSLALKLAEDPMGPDSSTGECLGNGLCLIPLDRGTTTGWSIEGRNILFPAAICTRITTGAALGVMASSRCPSKTQMTPACGIASSVNPKQPNPPTPGNDASFPSPEGNADFESAVASKTASEPFLTSLALNDANLFVGRSPLQTSMTMLRPGVVRLLRAVVIDPMANPQAKPLFEYLPPQDQLPRVAASDPHVAQYVAIADPKTQSVIACPTDMGCTLDAPQTRYMGGVGAIVADKTSAYFYGDGEIRTLDLASSTLGAHLPHPFVVNAFHLMGAMLYLGNQDGSVERCAVPCSQAPEVVLPAPDKPSMVTAFASRAGDSKLYFMRVPNNMTGDPSAGGVFEIETSAKPVTVRDFAPGTELTGGSPAPMGSGPPSLLAVDTRYVYWAGGGTVSSKRRTAGVGDKAAILTMQTDGQVTGLAVDDTHAFFTFFRQQDALMFAKKKSSF